MKRVLLFIIISLIACLASACTTGALSINTKLTLYQDQNWQATIEIVYSSTQMQLMGGEIERSLNTSISQWEAQNIKAAKTRTDLDNGDVKFVIQASGEGYDALNAAIFDNLATLTYDDSFDPPQITFRYVPVGTFFSLALSRTFSINGGEILDGNGIHSSKSMMTWVNPVSEMDVTLTPALRLDWLYVLLGVGGGLILAGSIVLIGQSRAKAKCYNCGAPVPKQAEFCPNCGASK